MYMLWFNFIIGLNSIFFCFKLIIIHYHTQNEKKINFKPRIKLNHNIIIFIMLHVQCMLTYIIFCYFYVILRIYKFIGLFGKVFSFLRFGDTYFKGGAY